MRISDFKKLKVERSSDFIKDDMCGIIVKTPEEIEKNVYGVYIGQLMYGTYTDQGPYEKDVDISSNKCLNSINKKIGDSAVKASNYIHLTMFSVYNISMPRLIKGENVLVGLIDQDIKSMYIKPFSRDQIRYRPTDTIENYVPASGKYDGDFLNDDNKYYSKLDSVSKTIRIHMSDANGEVSKYDITIDGTNGTISITDSIRSILLNTKDDEIVMSNEAGSTIALRKEIIDIKCEKFFLKATDSMTIECPKTEATLDDIKQTTDTYNATVDKYTIEGTKMKETFDKAIIDNSNNRAITCPNTLYDGRVGVTGWVCANGGIAFGAPKNNDPLPVTPKVDSKGFANFDGSPAAMMLVKFPPLLQLLLQMAIKIDIMGTNPKFPVTAPVIAPMLASLQGQMFTKSVKG